MTGAMLGRRKEQIGVGIMKRLRRV